MAASHYRSASVITTDIPPVPRRSSLKKGVASNSNWRAGSRAVVKSAHPLFPPDQVFLWLPGLPGEQVAHCTYKEARDFYESSGGRRPRCDKNRANFAPPYQVSSETYTSWHTDVTPPFPFHPIPIARTLSIAELADLGRRVHFLATNIADMPGNPLQLLRNNRKCFVLAVLAEMGYLAGSVLRPS